LNSTITGRDAPGASAISASFTTAWGAGLTKLGSSTSTSKIIRVL